MGERGWSLEVVRGREAGRTFALIGRETVLGNALGGRPGIDLAHQEADAPRRMAARQAVVESTTTGLAVRDLDSPGGTFVNRRRVLPGQSLPLQAGDVLQLGSVQLRVVPGSEVKPPASGPPGSPFVLKSGATCRTWDDFLRVAAQRWGDLRDELTSGRLDGWLASIGRSDLVAPRPSHAKPDDHLDAWLARLPTTRPARPELDVHPARLVVRVTPGGGTVARSVRVANVGHRLLHIKAAIEPAAGWVTVDGATLAVVDQLDLPLEITIPRTLPTPLRAALRLDGDGGSKVVELVLEAKTAPDPIAAGPGPSGPSPLEWLAGVPAGPRLVALGLGGFVLRFVVGVAGGTLGADGMRAAGPSHPGLLGVVAVFAVAAGVVGAILAGRRGGLGMLGFGAISAAIAGSGTAAVVVAACRAIEPSVLGPWATSPVAAALLWAAIGAAAAGASLLLAPDRKSEAETAP